MSRIIGKRTLLLRAFSLIELLVSIAIIGILATLTIAAVHRSSGAAKYASCAENQHQLGLAFALYHGDFSETFPGCASKTVYGPQPEDWIWWQRTRDRKKSAIAPFIASFNPVVFRCAADEKLRKQKTSNLDTYDFSYSLTSYDLEPSGGESGNTNINVGLASIFTSDTPRKTYPFKVSAVRNPEGKLMLVEEDRERLQDGRWVPGYPSFDPLAARHRGKAMVVFCDGHVLGVYPSFGTNLANSAALW